MFFLIGIIATVIMLLLLPATSFYGNRKITALFICFYSLLYFFIIQYGLSLHSSLELPLFFGASVLILYLTVVDRYINQKMDLSEFLKVILFIIIPILLCLLFQNDKNQIHLVDIIALALILGTNQSRFIKVPMVYQINTIEFYGLSTTSHLLILFIFLGYKKIEIDLFFISTIDVWVQTLVVCFFCCSSAILVGIKLEYLAFNFKKIKIKNLANLIIFNFFHIAIAEEIIYRGFVYNYLRQIIGAGDWIPLALATLLFGCHHISFGGKRMFVLSAIAGFFYGLIYVLTGNLLTAVIVHTITNIIWRLFFIIKLDLDPVVRPSLEVKN